MTGDLGGSVGYFIVDWYSGLLRLGQSSVIILGLFSDFQAYGAVGCTLVSFRVSILGPSNLGLFRGAFQATCAGKKKGNYVNPSIPKEKKYSECFQ